MCHLKILKKFKIENFDIKGANVGLRNGEIVILDIGAV